MSILVYLFLIGNLVASYFFARFVYNKIYKYYPPCQFKDEKGNIIDLHKIYHPFHPEDKLDFKKLWMEAFFCALFKGITSLLVAFFMIPNLALFAIIFPNSDLSPTQWKICKKTIQFYSKIFLYLVGIKINYKKVDCEEVYKKYLGPDYDFKDNKYSIIISNHTGFFEVVICMALYSGGFIAKKEVENYWFVGKIAKAIHCLFIDRTSEADRKEIFEKLEERQQGFYEGKRFSPLILFPEGTCTCGRDILKFKKGAFYSLLPIKPVIINVYQESDYHISCGAISVVAGYFRQLCHTIEPMYVCEMPVIRPTPFMYEKYKHLSTEKWEIYAEVTRKIYSEIGGLKENNMGKRDEAKYEKAVNKGIYDINSTPFKKTEEFLFSDVEQKQKVN